MLDKCTKLCRIIFLMSIIVMAVYFIYTNEKNSGKVKEHFETDQDYIRSINKVFNTLLNRPATDDELKRFRPMMRNANDTKDIIDALTESPEYKSAMEAGDTKVSVMISNDKKIEASFSQRMDTYRTIMQVYEEALNRLPNTRELNYYTYSMLTDTSFNAKKLRMVLESSKEYEILQKNQSNVVNGQLPGNVTETQVLFIIRKVYEEVYDEQPSQEVEEFLKDKLVKYKMDETKLKNLLLLLKTIDEENDLIVTENKGNSAITIQGTSADKLTSALQEMMEKTKKDVKSIINSEDGNETAGKKRKSKKGGNRDDADGDGNGKVQNVFNIINPKPEELDEIISKLESSTKRKSSYFTGNSDLLCNQEYKNKRFIDDFYDTIEQTKPPRKACDKKAGGPDAMDAMNRDRNMLAEYTAQRNFDELKMSCSRNTYAMQNDENLQKKKDSKKQVNPNANGAIMPDNYYIDTKPTFGTFLEEADNTKVGSIMPKFIYKEYQ